ncbi:MAG: LacI family transcriptional regulator [Firmicutes bacterium]|uniref:LacI family DNA-binding transcriptional regulator n=1 Tax=Limnochorda pilosa TaxID=1555112 RepID=UPI00180B075B|nr:LacI family DNA-binding transcriptional regulator [Limnochorda pilosa]MBO2520179.1 LacI family transcriptional regulator [Bacillota bacterium]NMA71102.1 LacI family transcriptional regulator [Bacillota bacterium]
MQPSKARTRRVTLRDVARAAGVSINTASRALNGKPDVSEATRARVQAVAAQLDYRPNQVARGLRQQKTATLGVVVADLANPFFAEVAEGIERTAATEGYSIILANSEENQHREEQAVRTLVERQVDGILITPTQQSEATVRYLMQRHVPFVLVARYFEGLDVPAVVNDDREGARLGVEHLITQGHREILFLNGPPYNSSAKLRLRGYQDALEAAGIPFRPSLVINTDARSSGGYAAIQQALASGVRFTAVACFSDYVSFGAIRALRQAKLRIPEDVAVIGYDDIDLAAIVEPALTTVHIAKTRLGQVAAHMLLGMIGSSSTDQPQVGLTVLPPQLVIRESS